jgi:hypothetical protein
MNEKNEIVLRRFKKKHPERKENKKKYKPTKQ